MSRATHTLPHTHPPLIPNPNPNIHTTQTHVRALAPDVHVLVVLHHRPVAVQGRQAVRPGLGLLLHLSSFGRMGVWMSKDPSARMHASACLHLSIHPFTQHIHKRERTTIGSSAAPTIAGRAIPFTTVTACSCFPFPLA